MLNITITEQTPNNMLRAIRAACNELLGETHAERQILNEVVLNLKNDEKAAQQVTEAHRLNAAANSELDQAAASLSAHNAQGGPVAADQFYRVGEQPSEQTTAIQIIEPVEDNRQDRVHVQSDVDSTGAEWNPELHASTKAKNQNGTWKKRRGAGKAECVSEDYSGLEKRVLEMQADGVSLSGATTGRLTEPVPERQSLPPLPPAPPAAPLVTMNDIYALITNGKAVLNDVIAAAQAMGFADVGAFSRNATPEQRAQLLAQLTKEVA